MILCPKQLPPLFSDSPLQSGTNRELDARHVTLHRLNARPNRVASCEAGVCYQVAEHRPERIGAFHLVYRRYREAGLIDQNRYQLRVTRYHLLTSTSVYIGIKEAETVTTVTLVRDGELGLPMECIFLDEVDHLRSQGIRLAEVSCLASEPNPSKRAFLSSFIALNRLMAQSAKFQGVDRLLIVIHPRHAPFYERYIGFRPVGSVRPYPAVENHPARLLSLDLNSMPIDAPVAYQRFFGDPIPSGALQARPIGMEDIHYFQPAAAEARHFVPMPMAG